MKVKCEVHVLKVGQGFDSAPVGTEPLNVEHDGFGGRVARLKWGDTNIVVSIDELEAALRAVRQGNC